jgi:hypothetical protein
VEIGYRYPQGADLLRNQTVAVVETGDLWGKAPPVEAAQQA